MVGLFAQNGGLLYGGGVSLLGTQFIGVLACGVFATVMAIVTFLIIKAIVGLRVSDHEQQEGLDIGEHGMSAYTNLDSGDVFSELNIN